MPSTCCVINCNSRSHDRSRIKLKNGISFYRFPAWKNNSTSHVSEVTKRRRMAWTAAVRRPKITFDNTPPHMMVCSKHFHKGKPTYEMLECDPDWAPSLYLGHTEVKAMNTDRFKRFRRRATRSQQQQPPSLGTDHTGPEAELDNAAPLYPGQETRPLPPAPDNAGREEDMETETSGDDGAPMGNVDEQQKCTMCGLRLKEIIRLQEENRKLKGELSKKALDENILKDNDSKVKYYTGLPSFSLLMGVLMQIIPSLPKSKTKERKLNHFQMLLLTLMHLRLDLPVEHVAHLFDVSRQTASNLFVLSLSFPKGGGGRASDKQITENCGFLQKLSSADLVLADRGFDIKESVALVGATLKIPAFTRGHSQLNAKDVEETRKLAHVRIHVERGEDKTLLDKIVVVC
uniref:THAP-type domain-containing protein n=1 Tax=Sander lucioperca TaxID=283035 RepID=A0A8C9XBM5_SANLU